MRARDGGLLPPRHEEAVPLLDGRRLGVAEFGAADGAAIFWFHGTPGARRQVPPGARRLARRLGVRLVGVERPGIGWSTPHLYGSVVDWARDVEEVADQLGIERFGAVGLSGGGPYVLACAHALPGRMVAGAVLGGVAPTRGSDAPGGGVLNAARPLAPLLHPLRGPVGHLASLGIRALHPFAERVFDLYVRLGPAGDRALLTRRDMRAMFLDDLLAGTRSGARSLLYDFLLFQRPWGFTLGEIRVPIHFWQGDTDFFVPAAHAAHLAARIPGAGVTARPGEGHLGALAIAEDAIRFVLSGGRRRSRGATRFP